jgi:hypothetical protein
MAQTSQKNDKDQKNTRNKRKTVAIGDLHGDYERMLRILNEQELLIDGTWVWNPDANNVDLILIGDYVDWRGEPLEGDSNRWKEGPKKILHLIYYLANKLPEMRMKSENFKSYIHPILGNHDQMMLEAISVFEFMDFNQLQEVIGFKQNYAPMKKYLNDLNLDYEQVEKVMKFLNWYYQGGEATIEGFGGIEIWKQEMSGELGDFLFNKLKIAAVVNKRLFSHSLPDRSEFWRPIDEILNMKNGEYSKIKEAFIWGRRIWGIDTYTNMRTMQPDIEEIDEMLSKLGVESAVVGHTPTMRREPTIAFDGRIVNIDLHGIPGSSAFIEEYEE